MSHELSEFFQFNKDMNYYLGDVNLLFKVKSAHNEDVLCGDKLLKLLKTTLNYVVLKIPPVSHVSNIENHFKELLGTNGSLTF